MNVEERDSTNIFHYGTNGIKLGNSKLHGQYKTSSGNIYRPTKSI